MSQEAQKLLRWFDTEHIADRAIRNIVGKFGDLAAQVASGPAGSEAVAAVRKLIEAKDCAVRAYIEGKDNGE